MSVKKMISARETAERWGIDVRRVQDYCKRGRVSGAERFGRSWMIPEDTARPADGRRKKNRTDAEENQPLIRKSPFLDMTDLYSTPGSADRCVSSLSDYPEAQRLFEAEIAYSRGEINKVYEHAQFFLERRSGIYAVIAGGMLLGLCAMWKGDTDMWHRARAHICQAPCRSDTDRDIITLSLASIETPIRATEGYPDWFAHGSFERLPVDAHPAARVFYIKYLMVFAQDLAAGRIEREDVQGLGFMKSLPYIIEPMISQAVAESTVMVEIYLRLLCAVALNQSGDTKRAIVHLDKAIALCLADRLYGPLVEHRRQLGLLLDDRIAVADPLAAKRVKELHRQLHAGWTKLHNAVLLRTVEISLSPRELEVARLAAYGLTNAEISGQLTLSVHTINAILNSIKTKTGTKKRSELGLYI